MPLENGEIRRLSGNLGKVEGELRKRAQTVTRKTALDIVRDAKAIAHQKFSDEATGATANSISHSYVGPMDVEIGPTTYYAKFVENGTSRMAAKPFMAPAAERHEGPFAEAMAIVAEEAMGV